MNAADMSDKNKAGKPANRPLALISLAYTCGIVVARIGLEGSKYMLLAVCLLIAAAIVPVLLKRTSIFLAALLLLTAVSGAVAFSYALKPSDSSILKYAGTPVYIIGTVSEEPLHYENHSAYRLRVESVETKEGLYAASGDVMVRMYGIDEQVFLFGEKLRLRGNVIEPRGLRNPGGFDQRFYLQSRGIDALIYPLPSQVEQLGDGKINGLTVTAFKFRSLMITAIEDALPDPASGLLVAILFGQRHGLPEEVEINFRRAGAGHLMAVSGLHVGLVAALVTGLFSLFKINWRFYPLLAIVLVLCYAFLTGLRPSAVRAAIMVSMALGALVLDRERDLPTAISIAALVTLFVNPLLLFSVGFQLSYAATLAIVYLFKPLEHFFLFTGIPKVIIPALAVTTAAQIGVLPLSLYYFYHLPLGGLVFNMALLPLMAPVVGLGLTGALVATAWEPLGSILLWAVRPLLEAMLFITGFSSAPWVYIPVQPPGIVMLALFYLVIILVLLFYYRWLRGFEVNSGQTFSAYSLSSLFQVVSLVKRRQTLSVCIFLAFAVVMVWSGLLFPADTLMVVTFIDVGQGAAALVEAPCGLVILIDAGGGLPFQGDPGSVGEKVVLPFLRHQGVNEIDLAVITHPHEDHYGGFIAIVEQLYIDTIYISPVEGGPETYHGMIERAAMKGAAIIAVQKGYTAQCSGGLMLEVLGPPEGLIKGSRSELNDNSIVIMLTYNQFRVLFTGDIEEAAARSLIAGGADLKADLLLVPHHGGYMASMPEFLASVCPAAAVIQVGTNPFGHPHPYIVAALNDAGVHLFRNDYHGAVIVKSDGFHFDITTTENNASGLINR